MGGRLTDCKKKIALTVESFSAQIVLKGLGHEIFAKVLLWIIFPRVTENNFGVVDRREGNWGSLAETKQG